MGKCFLHGKGGNDPLNFDVVSGTSAPSNPKENTIWVNTSTPITSYVFSATQPTNPTSGMVWISVGASSNAAFNALKKNGIKVYPVSAKQYVSGAWVDKTATSYQNGAWVDWWRGLVLYESGNLNQSLTGGFKNASSTTIDNGFLQWAMSVPAGTTQSTRTVNQIDLSEWDTITFEDCSKLVSGGQCTVFVSDIGTTASVICSANVGATASTIALDISGLSGKYYVGWYAYSEGGLTQTLKTSRIVIE